jgi:predicted solute-binding protein
MNKDPNPFFTSIPIVIQYVTTSVLDNNNITQTSFNNTNRIWVRLPNSRLYPGIPKDFDIIANINTQGKGSMPDVIQTNSLKPCKVYK